MDINESPAPMFFGLPAVHVLLDDGSGDTAVCGARGIESAHDDLR